MGMRVWTWRAWGKASFRGLDYSRGSSLLAGVCLLSFELWIGRFVQGELTLSMELLDPALRLNRQAAAALCALLVWDVRSNGNGTVNFYKFGHDNLKGRSLRNKVKSSFSFFFSFI